MKRISDSEETTMLVPVILEPIEIELALAIPLVEIRNVPVAVRVPPPRTNMQNIICTTTP